MSHEGKIGLIPTSYYEPIREDDTDGGHVSTTTDENDSETEQEPGEESSFSSTSGVLSSSSSSMQSLRSTVGRSDDQGSSKFLFGLKSFKKKRSESPKLRQSSSSKLPVISGPRASIVVSTPRAANAQDSETGSDGGDSDTETAESTTNADASIASDSHVAQQVPTKKLPREPRPPPVAFPACRPFAAAFLLFDT